GSLFVADLATGLSVSVTPQAPLPTNAVDIPIQGPGSVGVTTDASGNVVPIFTNGNTTGGSNLGGRIIRVTPQGQATGFAENFATPGIQGPAALANSGLTISMSADGTILYAADNQAIWQFKTVSSLADSSTGQYIGLSDLRALGAPYDGIGSGVAVIDT